MNFLSHRNISLICFLIIFSFSAVLNAAGGGQEETVQLAEPAIPKSDAGQSAVDMNDRLKIMYALQETNREVSRVTLPAVVEINVVEVIRQKIPQNSFSPWDFFGDNWPFGPSPFGPSPFEQPDQERENRKEPLEREFRKQGLGSGVIVLQNGKKCYVVTNNHVVGNADEISIRLHDGREFEAEIVGKDARTDLALITFESRDEVPVIRLGNSDSLQVGDFVFAVGNPFGFESTVTQGIVSALGRQAETGSQLASFTDYIQTDAAINPGNSGGALVNLNGELVGINTWIASRTGGSDGIGFAIPVNNVRKAVKDFIEDGKITYGWLGVSIADISEARFYDIAEDLNITDRSGVLVLNIYKGSPADTSGILPGDFITKVGDTEIRDSSHLTRVIGTLSPGTRKPVTLVRYGDDRVITIILEARREETALADTSKLWPGLLMVKAPDDSGKEQEVLVGGVIRGSIAETAGFLNGDKIARVNNRKVDSILDFYRELNSSESEEITFRVIRNGKEILLGLVR